MLVFLLLLGLAPTPPSGFAAGRGGRRLVESQFSTLLIEILWIGRAVASGGSNKLCRSCAPPRGVAAARCACGAHPSGVLLAASTPNATCDPKKHLRPSGSRARRRPHAEGCRWALQPISLLGTNSAGVKRYRGGQQKRQRVRLEESGGPQPPPRGGPQLTVAIPAGCGPKKYCDPPVARASRCRWALQPISLLGTISAGRLTRTFRVFYWPLPFLSASRPRSAPPPKHGIIHSLPKRAGPSVPPTSRAAPPPTSPLPPTKITYCSIG